MTISEKIQSRRKESGLSQEALAEKLGVSRQSVSNWETGATLPDTDKVVAMSKLFGVSTDYIINGVEEEKADSKPDNGEAPQAENITDNKKKPHRKIKKVIAAMVSLCLVAAIIAVPFHFGGIKETWWAMCGGKVQYTYVLVHGLGGWGESSSMNGISNYWGADTGDLGEYLTGQGYKVVEPTVGPVSSAWDRACELYAQLTGTTTDYGEAHSAAHSHERYGRSYDTPLVENWGQKINGGQRVKVNLVGHSFGGATVRLLASLLEYGDKDEKATSGDSVSPLFKGGNGDWVYSVTTLCAPHNGSSLTCVLDSVGSVAGIDNTTELLASVCFAAAGLSAPVSGIYDFMLDQFGIGTVSGGFSEVVDAISAAVDSGNDHAGYDLSPDGAAHLNSMIETVDGVYYFSYAFCTTQQGKILSTQVPIKSTLPVLYPTALAMGSYTGKTAGGIIIDETWQQNDGLVSVVSALHPYDEEWTALDKDNIKKGIWNVAETREGDHGTVIGMDADANETHSFYTDLFNMIDSQKR